MRAKQTSDRQTTGLPLDFRVLFESAPGAFVVLVPDAPRYSIVAVSDAYLESTATTRPYLVGKGIFEAFPPNPDDPEGLAHQTMRASLERVIANKRPDTMSVQKYDIRTPASGPKALEERYWSASNAPVLGADGLVQYIIHSAENVTEYVKLRQGQQQRDEAIGVFEERAQQMKTEILRRGQELQVANEQLAKLNKTLEERVDRLDESNRAILEMATVPIVTVWKGILLVPLIGMLDDDRAEKLMERLLSRLAETNAEIALIDITGVPSIDSQTALHLVETIKAVRIIGAQVVLTGVRPAIAQTLVHLGISLGDVEARSSLADGLAYAFQELNLSVARSELVPAI